MYLKFLTTEPKNSLFFHIQFFPVDEKISVWFFNFFREQLLQLCISEVVFYTVSS